MKETIEDIERKADVRKVTDKDELLEKYKLAIMSLLKTLGWRNMSFYDTLVKEEDFKELTLSTNRCNVNGDTSKRCTFIGIKDKEGKFVEDLFK